MAKFNYKMQNILNIKMRLETQAKTEFAEKSAQLAYEENKLGQLVKRKTGYEQQARQMAAHKLDIAQLRHGSAAIETMKELMRQQAVVVRVAQKNLDQAQLRLNASMQERKIQEKLKEKAFEEFKLELSAEEMKEIDQLVSFNYNGRDQTAED